MRIKNIYSDYFLGAHLSISKGFVDALETAEKLNFGCLQIFTKNASRWQGKKIDDKEAIQFIEKKKNSAVKFVIAHTAYLINIASTKDDTREKSVAALIDEIDRCNVLQIPYLVLHPGSHNGAGYKIGLQNIKNSLIEVKNRIEFAEDFLLLFETTAGQGNSIGSRLEEIADILEIADIIGFPAGVCLDTCHIFAAGYNIKDSDKYIDFMDDFNKLIGLERLKVIHINDSKNDLGTKKDRHEHIGDGFIGRDGFFNIMNDKRLLNLPKCLETPKGNDYEYDIKNLDFLMSLVEREKSVSRRRK